MLSGKYKIVYFHFLNPDTCMLQWTYNKRCIAPPNKVNNVFIAAFTTAYARLKLYSCLELMQDKILYVDTDSLIYVVKKGKTPLKLGNYLGDLTDELGVTQFRNLLQQDPRVTPTRPETGKKYRCALKVSLRHTNVARSTLTVSKS